MLLAELAAASETVGATSARSGKIAALAEALRAASPEEAAIAVAFLSGELRQRQIGVGWAALRERAAAGWRSPSLTLVEVDAAFAAIGALSGPGSQAARRASLAALFGRATGPEQRFLRALLSGDLRQGALEGVMAEAAAKAAGVPAADLRRALMLRGDLGAVAATALAGGVEALGAIGLEVGRGIRPMLASPAADIAAAMDRLSPAAVEWKLDGIRVQVHRDGRDVAVFTAHARRHHRARAARSSRRRSRCRSAAPCSTARRSRCSPTAARTRSRHSASRDAELSALFFDVLHLDGEDVLDEAGAARAERLAAVVPEAQRVPRAVAEDAGGAAAVLDQALAMGHEGVIVKSLDAPYAAGRRGAGWLKVKPVHTLDLVILAAEWGHGRRRGWLSNLHLGARHDAEPGQFVMLGKTFKGLTDAMLTWQTERLLELATDRGDWVVTVRPELVVEIAFDGIQRSTRYPGGVALRFARVLRHRPDKRAEEADTLASVLAVGGA